VLKQPEIGKLFGELGGSLKLTTPADLAYLDFLIARSAPAPDTSDSSALFPPRTSA
jgi:hypothetical protein